MNRIGKPAFLASSPHMILFSLIDNDGDQQQRFTVGSATGIGGW